LGGGIWSVICTSSALGSNREYSLSTNTGLPRPQIPCA
jgi:hypothetical protein